MSEQLFYDRLPYGGAPEIKDDNQPTTGTSESIVRTTKQVLIIDRLTGQPYGKESDARKIQ